MKPSILLIVSLLLGIAACGPSPNVEESPTFTESGHLRAIIEIPAGTNRKVIYDSQLRSFYPEQVAPEQDRIIDFLPYPANYGFIPSTRMTADVGGDGDPLDVFIIAESLPTAAAIEVLPLAVIETVDEGELDPKILAVPLSPNRQIIQAKSLAELNTRYPAIQEIMTLWLQNYDPADSTQVVRWGDEQEAMQMIQRWQVSAH